MMIDSSRRAMVLGLGAVALAGCSSQAARFAAEPAAEQVMRAVPNAGFDAWVAGFRGRAAAAGIAPGIVSAAFADVGYLPGVIERDRNQTEFTRTLEDYLAIAASPQRVTTGREMLSRHGASLTAIERRFGVDAAVVAAVWGVESNYGSKRGTIPVISALSTLAYDGRRGAFFEKQLVAALRILQNGDISANRMTGSWAGAMGHTQFIPTSYEAFAVDFTGDGRRDIWSEDPSDALASTAAYLAKSGWRTGQPWGLEVRLPAGFGTAQTGRDTTRSVGEWAARGVTLASGGAVPDHGSASILIPQGLAGPAFIVFRNFTVISRYNNAVNYVIGVGHLSDRLRGAGPLRAAFPPDAQGMTIADRQALQERLTNAGYDTQGTDGVIGPKTREAISAFQRSRGLAVTGEPSLALLAALR